MWMVQVVCKLPLACEETVLRRPVKRGRLLRLRGRNSIPCLKRLFFIVILILNHPVFSKSAERALLNVILNQEEEGEYFLSITEEADILFPLEYLKSLGMVNLPEKAIIFDDSVSLKSLYPEIKYTINESDASLLITASPKLFKEHVIDFTQRRPSNMITEGVTSLVLNYAVDYSGGSSLNSFFNVPLEAMFHTGRVLFLSNFLYNKSGTDTRFARLMSSLIIDDQDTLTRYTFGDFYGFSGELGGIGNFGGISVNRIFSINPYFVKFPDLPLSGVIQTTSQIEVYINGALVRKETLPPGEFSIVNVPVTAGAGDTMIVIRDAFGREEFIMNPYYYSQLLLKPGLHEFSYNLGFKRKNFGTENFAYEDPSLIGFHRYGFTKWFTGGINAEMDRDTFNAGLDAIVILGLVGDLSLAGSLSNEMGRFGNAFSLGYAYSSRNFYGRFSIMQSVKSYANLSLSSTVEKPHWQVSAGAGFYQRHFGSLSFNASYMTMHSGDTYKNMFCVYTRKLFNNGILFFRVQRSVADEVRNEFFVGANAFFGKRLSGSIDY